MRSPALLFTLALSLAPLPALAQAAPSPAPPLPAPPAPQAAPSPAITAPPPMAAPMAPGAAPVMQPPYGYYYPPPYWAPPPQPFVTERRSRGMMIAGISLWVAGGIVGIVGAGMFTASLLNECVFLEIAPERGTAAARTGRERVGTARQAFSTCDGGVTIGASVAAAGLLTAVAGVPLFVIGSKRVRARPNQSEDAWTPELRVTGTGAALRWSY